MAPTQQQQQTASGKQQVGGFLNPENAVAGGLRNRFEGTIESARYEAFDFKGKAKGFTSKQGQYFSGVKMCLHLHIVDCDDSPEPVDEYLPAAPIEWFAPNDEGTGFEAVKGHKGFDRDSEIIQFMGGVIATGAAKPADLDVDPTFLEGYRFFFERESPKWAERKVQDDPTKRASENVLVPRKLIEAPKGNGRTAGGAKAAASTRAAAAASNAKDDASDDTQLAEQLVDITVDAIKRYADENAKAEHVSREDLGAEVFAWVSSKTNKDKVTRELRLFAADAFKDDAFLVENAGRRTWKYNEKKGVVVLD